MGGKDFRQVFDIRFFSPVHIDAGKGGKLDATYAFRIQNCQLIRYNEQILLEIIGSDKALLDNFIKDGIATLPINMDKVYKTAEVYQTSVDFSRSPQEIYTHIANGAGDLYIPGSSLKGAIRTALLWTSLDISQKMQSQILNRQDGREAGQPLQRKIFTKDPSSPQWQNYDLLRAMKIRDSNALPPKGHVNVIETKVADVKNNQIEWIHPVYVEYPSAQDGELRIEVIIDQWLLSDKYAQDLDFQSKANLLCEWGKRCNDFACYLISHEMEFAQKYRLLFLEQFYKDIQNRVNQRPNSIFLQIGWGTGWVSKTVTKGFGEEFVEKARLKFALGRIRRYHRNCGGNIKGGRDSTCFRCHQSVSPQDIERQIIKPFPKSRKIAFKNGSPHQPMGWIELCPV